MGDKTVIKRTQKGVYYIEIPQNHLRITKWREGDIVEVMLGNAVTSKKDDLILRKVF